MWLKHQINHVLRAAVYSWQGLRFAFALETAFRLELIGLIIFSPLAWWLGHSAVEKALMIGSLIMVLIAELINSAIEKVVDRIGTEIHPLSGQAKDIGSAAVFVAFINVLVIWGIIIFGH